MVLKQLTTSSFEVPIASTFDGSHFHERILIRRRPIPTINCRYLVSVM
jgi:hypothetical protein